MSLGELSTLNGFHNPRRNLYGPILASWTGFEPANCLSSGYPDRIPTATRCFADILNGLSAKVEKDGKRKGSAFLFSITYIERIVNTFIWKIL